MLMLEPSYERGRCARSGSTSSSNDTPCTFRIAERDHAFRPVPAKRLLSMLLLLLLTTVAWWVASGRGYGALLAWLHFVDGVGLAGVPLLVGVQAATFLLAMPLWPVELASGFIYGFWFGVPVACLAYTIGCVPPFLLSRWMLRASDTDVDTDILGHNGQTLASAPAPAAARCPSIVAGMRAWLDRRNVAGRISTALEREPFMCVLCLRISPINASGVLSYLLGLTAVPLRDYTTASALGGAPMVAVFVYFGTAIDSLAELATGRAPQNAQTELLLVCGGVGCFVGMCIAALLAARRLREAERRASVGAGTHDNSTRDSCDTTSDSPQGGTRGPLGDRSSKTQQPVLKP